MCPGSCNAAWRNAEKLGEPLTVAPVPGASVWCENCMMRIDTALRALPHDATLLWLEVEHGTPQKREHVSGSKSRPLHEGEHLSDMIHGIAEVLTEWEGSVRELRRYSKTLHGTEGKRIERGTKFLLGNLPWILRHHPAAVEFGEEIMVLHRKAQEATHHLDASPVKCIGVRCPKCTWKALVREVSHRDKTATGYVKCENCQALLTQSEYQVQVKASYMKVVKNAAGE